MFSVAPMMGVTNRFSRYLYRILTREATLYTEMEAVDALLRGKCWEELERGHPNVVLQIGGSNLEALKVIAPKIEKMGYKAVNLNAGCPSNKVQAGKWGACLMKEPVLMADCVKILQENLSIPVTVKCRIGVDSDTGDKRIKEFLTCLSDVNCSEVIIHARNAILNGLSPSKNRTVPPLNYDLVYKMKDLFPKVRIVINGGIKTLEEALEHLQKVDGVMLGRAVKNNPFILAQVDRLFYNSGRSPISRGKVVEEFFLYAQKEVREDESCIKNLIQTVVPMIYGLEGSSQCRRKLMDGLVSLDKAKRQLLELCYSKT